MDFKQILVTSGYGHNTRQPYTQMAVPIPDNPSPPGVPDGYYTVQLLPEEARDLAQSLIQAAEAAEQDQFIFEFHTAALTDKSDEERDQIGAAILGEYRKFRINHGLNK